MTETSIISLQLEDIIKKRKKTRAVSSLAIGVAVYLFIIVMVMLMSAFLPLLTITYVLIIGALAGAATGIAFYLVESYPELKSDFEVEAQLLNGSKSLSGVDAALVNEIARRGVINIKEFSQRTGIDKFTIIARLNMLERAGIIKIKNVIPLE